jgi:hypothetical protein
MAFTDALVAASDADVVIVDRRHAPGGHWLDSYPFVTLHQPSSYYGVNSLALGADAIDRHGSNRGLYERASGPEICAYFRRAMDRSLLPTGRVRYFPMSNYLGDNRFVSYATGVEYEVKVRKKIVDARYLEPALPANTPPPFDVSAGARCVSINDLVRMADHADGFVVIGAGKTAVDACLWLLDLGVRPGDIRWVRPREAWLVNRVFAQGGELVGTLFEGISLQVEAAARATSLVDLFERLEAAGQLLRIDECVTPTMYRGATVSSGELDQLRRIEQVVRLGHVRRIDRDAIVLDGGTIPTSPRQLHVHCAAAGLNPAPATEIFTRDRVTLQPARAGLIPFNAALVGFVEATRDNIVEQNRLCPPNRLPSVPLDWVRGTLVAMNADYAWSKAPDISDWLEHARLNPGRGLRQHEAEPRVQQARARYATHIRSGLAKLNQFASA